MFLSPCQHICICHWSFVFGAAKVAGILSEKAALLPSDMLTATPNPVCLKWPPSDLSLLYACEPQGPREHLFFFLCSLLTFILTDTSSITSRGLIHASYFLP